jgi:hypothetical protein
MKKTKKIICLLLLIVLIPSLLVACTADELALLNSFSKSTNLTSMESKTEITLNFSAQGLSVKDQQSFDQISAMFSGSKIIINQKSKSNDAKTITKSQTDVSMNMGGMGLSASVWLDSDIAGTTPKIKEIIKVPSILTMSFPAKYQGKPYMVMDLNQMLKTSPTSNINTKELMVFSQNFTPKVMDFLKEYAKQFDPGFKMITRKEDKIIDGQTLSIYNLKLDDSSFKNLLSYTVTNFSKNEKALSFAKEFLLSVTDMISVSDVEKVKTKQEISKSFDELKTDYFLNQWNKVMAILKEVKMLGDKGIDIDFAINSDGYIVNESGTFDFVIDLKAYSDAGQKINALEDKNYINNLSNQQGIYKISVDFNSDISNINKDIVIDIPAVNSQNSFNYIDYMNSLTRPEIQKDITAPSAPIVNKVLKTSKTVTGKAEIGSTVVIKKGNVTLGTATTNSKGIFSVTIKPLNSKSTLLITATDKSGNMSKVTTIYIK